MDTNVLSVDNNDMDNSSELDIRSILSSLNISHKIEGNNDSLIKNVASLTSATLNDLSFCSCEGDMAVELISQSNAGIILCKKSLYGLVHPREGMQLVFLDNPRFVFVN